MQKCCRHAPNAVLVLFQPLSGTQSSFDSGDTYIQLATNLLLETNDMDNVLNAGLA